jgi:RNA polymerase sigma-70 factor, ECF subfamily
MRRMDRGRVDIAMAAGAKQWPEVRLSADAVERYLNNVLGASPPPDWTRHAADLYLCCACIQGDAIAQRILEAQFLSQLVKSVARIRSNDDFIQDTLQALRTRLLVGPEPRLLAYSGLGPLLAWLRVTVTRLALDSLRAAARDVHCEESLEHAAARELDPLGTVVKARYAQVFQRALHDALQTLSDRDRNLLRLRLVDGCGIDRLGCIYQVDRATAARWLKSARQQVLRRVRQQLSDLYGLTRREFQSLARSVISQLDLRPSALLVASPAEGGSLPADGEHGPSEAAARRERDHAQ